MFCSFQGCIYNQNGECAYENAPVKQPAARACNEPIFEEG